MGIFANYPVLTYPLASTYRIPVSTELSYGEQPQDGYATPDQLQIHGVAPVALTDAANIAIDTSTAKVYTVTLAGNRTLANPTNTPQAGQEFDIIVTQDATGSRTLAYGTSYKAAGGSLSLTATANAYDRVHARVISSTLILLDVAAKAYA